MEGGDVFAFDPSAAHRTTYTRDACDLLSGVSYTSEPTTWSFSYHPTHALTEVGNSGGKTWAFTYDSGVRLISASDENNPALGSLGVGWTYDQVSHVTGLEIGPLRAAVPEDEPVMERRRGK